MEKFLEVIEFEDLIKKSMETLEEHDIRVGQCLMNVLFNINREVHDSVMETDIDPYYHEDRVHNFLVEISPVLEGEEKDNISELIVNFSVLNLPEQWG